MPLANISILVLRRSDLNKQAKGKCLHEVELHDFRKPREEINSSSHVVFIDGTQQRILKNRGPEVTYNKASYFRPKRVEQKVVDGRLITAFPDDDALGFKAGTLFCEPWTEEDGNNIHNEDDDVLGATVTREGQAFHDAGVYVPNPSGYGI